MMNQYFNYLNQVLGVRSVLLPLQPMRNFADCLFLTTEENFNNEQSELFLKMVSAMKLSETDFELLGVKESEITSHIEKIQNSKAIVAFDQHLYQYLSLQFPHAQIFLVAHPKEMLANAGLKKAAWEELKKVLAVLQ